jgi:hypothetical protein
MQARLAQLATPRRLVATECCIATVAAFVAVLMLGATPLALLVFAACALTMAPPLVAVTRLDRRDSGD